MAILNKSISGDTQSVEEAIGDYAKVCLSSVFVFFLQNNSTFLVQLPLFSVAAGVANFVHCAEKTHS